MAKSREGVPEKLSPSRIKDFKQCPRLFYYKSILKIGTPPTEATVKGTLAHYAFERIFDHPREERTPDTAVAYLAPAWRMMTEPLGDRAAVAEGSLEFALRQAENAWSDRQEPDGRMAVAAREYRELIPEGSADEKQLLAATEAVVRSWFSMENPQKFDPAGREKYVIGKLGGATVHGFIDRLDEFTKDGQTTRYVSDYKTGKKPAPRFQDEAFFQLEVYAALLEHTENARPDVLRLVYVKEGNQEGVLVRRITADTTARTVKQIRAVSQAVNKAAETNSWETRQQRLCDWCFFQSVCPAFHPELEGLLPEEIEHQARLNNAQSLG